MKTPPQQRSRGFTLVEIAIVLVIIGLIIGGVLRGQELIDSARVRKLVSQQSAVQTAYYGFIDRYEAVPGDLNAAQAAKVSDKAAAAPLDGNGIVTVQESHIFFNNLAQAGYISCPQCMTAVSANAWPVTTNSPINPFGKPMWFYLDSSITGAATGGYHFASLSSEASRAMLSTGEGIASTMLAELDRKVDDGNPAGGTFRHGNLKDAGSRTSPAPTTCAGTSGASPLTALVAAAAPSTAVWATNPKGNDCQGMSMF